MRKNEMPRTAMAAYDHQSTLALYRRLGPLIARLFRLRVTGLENIRPDRPGILAANHNAGGWGIIDVVLIYYAFHNLQRSLGILSAMSEETTFSLPGLGRLAALTGLKVPSVACLGECLDAGHWVLVTPGANTDQLRSIWLRSRVRFQKTVFVGSRSVQRDQHWHLDAAFSRDMPVYPVAVSGTHEMTPILWESLRLYRWTGLKRLRGDEHWPGFPITLNHIVNAVVFALTPLASSLPAWVVFTLLNIYVDALYSYPIFPFQVRIHFGSPIYARDYQCAGSLTERQTKLTHAHEQLVSAVEASLRALDRDRWWMRMASRLRPRFSPQQGSD